MGKCGMWKITCGMTVIGTQVRSCDRRYYAAYSMPRVAGAVVNCVSVMYRQHHPAIDVIVLTM